MRVARSINRHDFDEDDVGRAGYNSEPAIDQTNVVCTVFGVRFTAQQIREMGLGGVAGAFLSFIIFALLYSVNYSDSLTILSMIAMCGGVGAIFHKSRADLIQRTPLKKFVYKMAALITFMGVVMAFALRFDRRTYEQENAKNAAADPYAAAYASSSTYESSFGFIMSTTMHCIIAASFIFILSVLLCDYYNKNLSAKALADAAEDPEETATRGISELSFSQLLAVALVTVWWGTISGVLFSGMLNNDPSSHHKNGSSSAPHLFCFHQIVAAIGGVFCGCVLSYVNYGAVEENAMDNRVGGPNAA